jgi:hypothetical protein
MDQVGNLLKRPKAYNNIDGTGELAMGFYFLGSALLMWLLLNTPKDAIWHQNMYVFFLIWVGFSGLMNVIISYGIKAIKNHITYPRTGFVAYRRLNGIWMVWMLIIAGVGAPLIGAGMFLAARSHRDIVIPVFFLGLLLAARYAYHIARRSPWKWAVVLALVLGALVIAVLPIAALPGDVTAALAGESSERARVFAKIARIAGAFLLLLMLDGTMLLISGGISLWLYLRHTQAPAKEGE